MRFPGDDGGRSLVEMAQSDLDAALQLLADRAQYITGATGAAIALRRDGRNDMLCRASTGTNAPELGALLSTEFGLSGESVRTRQLLRCDDAERDARVNREVCREMGIASVLVMPVVNDDQVLGVFEIFSGKANAFGERDLSAVQRLSEMVETAVRMANAAQSLPEQLNSRESAVAEAIHPEVFEGQFLSDLVVEEDKRRREVPGTAVESSVQNPETMAAAALESPIAEAIPPVVEASASPVQAAPQPVAPYAATLAPPKKPLFWSAAAGVDGDSVSRPSVADDSHVPPVLRGLRKCEACGFPISAGRVLCVECEEKKWRGQLRPQQPARKMAGVPTAGPSKVASASGPASSIIKAPSVVATQSVVTATQRPAPAAEPQIGLPAKSEETVAVVPRAEEPAAQQRESSVPEFVLSAGMEPSRSWFSTYKWILLVVGLIGGGSAAFLFLR